MSAQERRPALVERNRTSPKPTVDDDYLFSAEHVDNATRIDTEMCLAFARQMLYQHPNDPLDTPLIRERRHEAARAALDVLWAIMAERNVQEDLPPPTPALLALRLRPQRRLRRTVS